MSTAMVTTNFTQTYTIVDYEATTTDNADTGNTNAMIYGYGTASVAIISCFSLLGIALFPALNRKSYKLTLQFFIGLAVGTMTADAFLHLIPIALGIHNHEDHEAEDEHDEDHEEESEDTTIYAWKMSVVCAGLYLFFFLENGLNAWKRWRDERKLGVDFISSSISLETQSSEIPRMATSGTSFKDAPTTHADQHSRQSLETISETKEERNILCSNWTTTLLTVFIGDALHNIADGIAIGVSFASSWTTGVGTSIAVLFHEVPHELGDFAIYLNNGASKWKAILLNLAAACCAFIGLYTGIALGDDKEVQSWLLALVAGMFLYIALVQVTSEMVREKTSRPLLQFLLQNLGLVLGWTLMLLISLYEEDIEASITG